MPFNTTTPLVQLAEAQSLKFATVNALTAALSPAALFGVRSVSGLVMTLYGGMLPIAGTPTYIADQAITLTASATNYIYATSAGVVTKTTSIPGSWPGPLAAGAVALYAIITGASTITSGTCYRIGTGLTGPIGATGALGPAGSDFAGTRKRILMAVGGGGTTSTYTGNEVPTVTGTATAVTLSSASLRQSIPQVAYVSSAPAGSSAQINQRNTVYFGDAAGRGGFTVSFRFCMESANSPANQRSFFGLYDRAVGALANAEPDTFVNIIGIGAKAADANFRIIHNDAAGTATMVAFATPGNFPARATDNVYELVLASVSNSSVVTGSLTNVNTGATESFSFSSDIPANTLFFGNVLWTNNGSTASAAAFGLMQVVTESRY